MRATSDEPNPKETENGCSNKHNCWFYVCTSWEYIKAKLWKIVNWPHAPHYMIAIFTLFLVIFAYYAWDESTKATAALQEQVLALKADQRPLIWVTEPDPAPVYLDESGQVLWGWKFRNIGKSVAYNTVMDQYVRLGNEHFQRGRNRGLGAIELQVSKPVDIPPNLPGPYATLASRPGISKEFFSKLLEIDGGISFLVEFWYSDASGKTQYFSTTCFGRLKTGALSLISPGDCSKQ